MFPAITSVYAGLLALMFVGLSVGVIGTRRRKQVTLGDGEDPVLRRRIRVHANFAEYVPFALLLIALVEMSGMPVIAVHLLGVLLIVGRGTHAYGVARANENIRYRVAGMAMTFTAIIAAALTLIINGLIAAI